MTPTIIIGLTGEKLAGKGTVALHLQATQQAQILRFSQPLSDALQRLHQPNSRAALVGLGTAFRQLFGDDVLGKVLLKDIQATTASLVVVDGLRYLSELELCRTLPNFYLLNITAPIQTRFERTKQRSEKTDEQAMTLLEFTQREQDTTEQQITLVQQQANTTIVNDGSFTELYQAVDQWLNAHS